MKVSREAVDSILTRNVVDVIERESLEQKLVSGKKLRIKLGADPTSPDLHLGHAVLLWKLREFQELGHKIVFIIGDFTGLIGDPSDRSQVRPVVSEKEIQKNAKTYFTQAGKILDTKKIEIHRNSTWLKKIPLSDWFQVLRRFTVSRILERDDFQKRFKRNEEIWMHEIMYPLLQAYDSIAVGADVELGGQDQLFNLMAGRHLMEKSGKSPQDILVMNYVIGLDGTKKMSKSLGNYIGITDAPRDMFGKLMSIPDDLIVSYFELTTKRTQNDIRDITKRLDAGKNPRDIKIELARDVVSLYHGSEAGERAKAEFIKVFSKKELPDDMDETSLPPGSYEAAQLLLDIGFARSRSEAWRLIEQGAMGVIRGKNAERIMDPRKPVVVASGLVIRVGKTRFVKVK